MTASKEQFRKYYWEDLLVASMCIHNMVEANVLDKLSARDFEEIERLMERYDAMAIAYIEHWIGVGLATIDDILIAATRNQDRYGTEPKMMLKAIEDYYSVAGKYVNEQ